MRLIRLFLHYLWLCTTIKLNFIFGKCKVLIPVLINEIPTALLTTSIIFVSSVVGIILKSNRVGSNLFSLYWISEVSKVFTIHNDWQVWT